MKQFETGVKGEAQAEKYLTERGMTCVARRFRGLDGEIDLIMLDGDTVVITEVKYRPGSHRGAGLLAVTPAKQLRMLHAAQAFLTQREWTDRPVRFDVVEISADGLFHLPNAFIPGWR